MKNVGFITKKAFDGSTSSQAYYRQAPSLQAQWALQFLERWGLVAGEDGGEDSQGRAKYRLQAPDEAVQRACAIAEKLYEEFERRDWLLEVPDPTPPTKDGWK